MEGPTFGGSARLKAYNLAVTRQPSYLPAIILVGLGVALELVGLAIDARLHESDPGLGEEGLVAFKNPGHVIAMLGVAMTVAGVLWAVVLAPSARNGRAYWLGRALPGFLFLTLAVGTASYVALADTSGLGFAPHGHPGEMTDSAHIDDLSNLTPEEIALVSDSRHEHATEIPLLGGDLDRLQEQVAVARTAAAKYEDISAALRDGYAQITQDLPLIGAHFIHREYSSDGLFDPARPEMLVYGYQDGSWRLYGFSYITRLKATGEEDPPEGFAGPLDVWHTHLNWCFTLSGARVTDAERCGKLGGYFVERQGYMLHLWTRDNPNGLFSHSHPDLKGSPQKIFDVVALLRLLRSAGD
jgi:hypothetical protein